MEKHTICPSTTNERVLVNNGEIWTGKFHSWPNAFKLQNASILVHETSSVESSENEV